MTIPLKYGMYIQVNYYLIYLMAIKIKYWMPALHKKLNILIIILLFIIIIYDYYLYYY